MYYFLQIRALRRWTLMYVIRFSKINIAQVSSITLESSIQFSLCQEEKTEYRHQRQNPDSLTLLFVLGFLVLPTVLIPVGANRPLNAGSDGVGARYTV